MSDIYAVKHGNTWYIAKVTKAEDYGGLKPPLNWSPDTKVWSECGTTALICKVDDEQAKVWLDEA